MDLKTQQQPRPTTKHKLSAIMFTDMTGFSRKMGESEKLTLRLLRDHNRIIRFLVRKHHGEMIKSTGDGFLLDFGSAVEAVQCALEAQERFQRYNYNKPDCEQIIVRIGVNLGEVRIVDEDLFGDEVNIAARIQTLAEPGGICISRDVYDHVKTKLQIVAVNLGPKDLKNIRHQVEVYKILVPTAGQEAIEIPTMNLSLLEMAEKANGTNGRKPENPRANILKLLAGFGKKIAPPMSHAKPAPAFAAVSAVRETASPVAVPSRRATLLLKTVPMLFLTMMLPTVWIASHSSESNWPASFASMAQWISGASYATTPKLPLNAVKKTIAVLYFENRTKDPRDNWMSIGLADMLITDLENTPALAGHVFGRPRLMDTLKELGKGNAQSMDLSLARAVAERAKADLMLIGTIARDGKTLRIDTQLYDVRRGEMLLAGKAQGESIFKMVDELAHKLKKQMLPTMQAMM
ncbi:adenylate/guanylate cyclase domain-containing protein [candidate division KSB1 bacterium]|nr:adenylate/guanylate cyclase domain-containing protein [candidate division KSB1 bacterium]